MKPFPHVYRAEAAGTNAGRVAVSASGLPTLETDAPVEFDGPGDAWSPEMLLVAAVADCFILTFRAVARAARMDWLALECTTQGVLERSSGAAQFSRFETLATLTVPAGTDHAKAAALLERAERNCLIANSLRGERTLETRLVDAPPPAATG